MGFTWKINIKKNPKPPPRALFEFDQPPQIQVGDQIIWSNNDSQPHFPTPVDQPFVFMANQIAGNSTSPAFTPNATGTISYVCSLHLGEGGTIDVVPPAAGGDTPAAAADVPAATPTAPAATPKAQTAGPGVPTDESEDL